MAHTLILGMTESGKTTLAKRLANNFRRKGTGVIVLDPLSDPEWNADFVTYDSNEFIAVVKRSQRCALFVDESGEMIGQYGNEMFWLATRARHYGHQSLFIVQRAQQLSPTVRTQCANLALFACSRDDAKILANEFNNSELLKANELRKGECYYTSKFGDTKKITVFT